MRGTRDHGSSRAELYEGLLTGMHAAAQPLTLLQSRLYLALARNASAGAEDPLLDAAASELETLCSLFRLLQQLLHLESAPAKIAATPLADVAAALVEDAEVVFAGSETRLRVQLFMPVASGRAALPQTKEIADVAAMPCLQVDAARTRTALSQILAAARECVAGADLLCQVRQSLLEVELLIEAEAVAVDGSAEPWRLGASTHGGKVEPAHEPGCVRVCAQAPFRTRAAADRFRACRTHLPGCCARVCCRAIPCQSPATDLYAGDRKRGARKSEGEHDNRSASNRERRKSKVTWSVYAVPAHPPLERVVHR